MKTKPICGLLVVGMLVLGPMFSGTELQGQQAKELSVKVQYQGAGEVDSRNGIHLYLFDTPNISAGSMPIAMSSAWQNGSEVTFSYIHNATVYMVGAYGAYDPNMGPPPTGTPVAFYRAGEPTPTPIAMDKDKVQIEFTFDDSFRMP